ncbi:MAG: 3-deoxy-D-manno-octulosonic acid transferase, partial [Bacteroidales bacterium]|nr:3-deoxy-D-manno-octulosonic acid transferase [Bacteroidales bacterium]
MHSIYNLFIAIYGAILRVASLFSHKISTMCEGESKAFDVLSAIKPDDKVVWFHCASLGEFEQGRMLIESLKRQQPDFKILLSFYSPSGYEVRKNYSYADWVVYLPNDTAANARKFVSLANPLLTFFVKYEFWYNYLIALEGRRVFQVSLIMRPKQYFFKPYGKWFAKRLKVFEHFFVQNEQTKDLLCSIGYDNVTISGDTRFDRVIEVAKNVKHFQCVDKFCQTNKKILLAGS